MFERIRFHQTHLQNSTLVGFKSILKLFPIHFLHLFLLQHEASQDETIHLRSHKTPPGILRRANNRFTTHIERCIDENRASRLAVELCDEIVKHRVLVSRDCLQPSRSINVSYSGNRTLFRRYGCNKQHERTWPIPVKVVFHFVFQNRRSERTKDFAELYFEINDRLVFGIARICQNTSASKGPRTELHPPLTPANDMLSGNKPGRFAQQLLVLQLAMRDILLQKEMLYVRVGVLRAQENILENKAPRIVEQCVVDIKSGSK